MILFIIIQILNSYGQNRSEKREYVFIDHSYEKITLKSDSFNFIFSVGLISVDVDGTINYRNDTLILNSEFQVDRYKIEKKYNSNLKKNEFEVIIIDSIFKNQIELFATKKIKRKKKTSIEPENENSALLPSITIKKYIVDKRKYIKKKGLIVKVWRTNSHINLNLSNKKLNSISIDFSEYPGRDYFFLKNVEAIETEKGLIFLGKNNDLTKTSFSIENKTKKNGLDRELKIYRQMQNK